MFSLKKIGYVSFTRIQSFLSVNEPFWMKQFVKAALVQQYITCFLLKGSQPQYSRKTRNKPNTTKEKKHKL